MNGEADCPTDLEMAAPKGQGRSPLTYVLFSHTAVCRAHSPSKGARQSAVSELRRGGCLRFQESSLAKPNYLALRL